MLLLEALTRLDITPREADSVPLVGGPNPKPKPNPNPPNPNPNSNPNPNPNPNPSPNQVPLDGANVDWLDPSLPAAQRRELDWAADALTSCLPARSLAIVRDGRTLGLRGTLSARVVSDEAAYSQAR